MSNQKSNRGEKNAKLPKYQDPHDVLPFKYMFEIEKNSIEKYLVAVILGICDLIENQAISIEEAENFVFSIDILRGANYLKLSPKLINIIERGMELDDIRELVSAEEVIETIHHIRELAISFLTSNLQ